MGADSHWIVLSAVVGWGLLTIFCGYGGISFLMSQNPCEMTYSHPSLQLVPVNSTISGYSLFVQWADSKGQETRKKSTLRPYPVLFVPGHSGRYSIRIKNIDANLFLILC